MSKMLKEGIERKDEKKKRMCVALLTDEKTNKGVISNSKFQV